MLHGPSLVPVKMGYLEILQFIMSFPLKTFFLCDPPIVFVGPLLLEKCEKVGGLIENRQACWIGPWLLGSTHTGMCWLFESHIWLPNLHA